MKCLSSSTIFTYSKVRQNSTRDDTVQFSTPLRRRSRSFSLTRYASLTLQLREYPERMCLGVKNVLLEIDSVVWVLDKIEVLEGFR